MVLVIAGGTGSIGGTLAEACLNEARGIVIFGRTRASKLAQNNVLPLTGDVRSARDVETLCEETVARFGRIDALVNCAGQFPRELFLNIPHAQWQEAVETNLLGFSTLCRFTLPHMVAQKFGRIINIATRLATKAQPGTSAYASSKIGAHLLMKCLAADLAPYPNILINDLIPGPTRNVRNPNGQDPKLVVPFLRQLLLLPPGGPSGKTFFRGQLFDLMGK
jgi:NAD(P)-dependent dehydrogenase (short-subunit alcohol dehydrogenase family)